MIESLARLEARGIRHEPINDYADVVTDPQVIHNESFRVVKGATGSPITLVSIPCVATARSRKCVCRRRNSASDRKNFEGMRLRRQATSVSL